MLGASTLAHGPYFTQLLKVMGIADIKFFALYKEKSENALT